MSFVSVVATEKFVTIMSDGRVVNMDTGDLVEENFQKYVKVNEKAFVAFSGTKDTGEIIARKIAESIHEGEEFVKIHQILVMTIEGMRELITDDRPVSIVFGGFNSKGEAEVLSYASKSKQSLHYKPKGDEFATIFLTGARSSLTQEEIYNVFEGFMKDTIQGDSNPSPTLIIQSQKLMNNYIADRDDTVNKTTFRLVLKK